MIKKIIKKILPKKIYNFLAKINSIGLEWFKYKKLNSEEIFTKIYNEKKWDLNKNNSDKFYSGLGSHEKKIVDPYVKVVNEFIVKNNILSLVDAGCGDFNIGKQLVKFVKKYYAIDICNDLIKYNKNNFNFNNLEFFKKDISVDQMPCSDLILVRQVLQHLSNEMIKNFLNNIKNKYNFLILTEHYAEDIIKINDDKSTGPGLRFKSCIMLDKEPFNLTYIHKEELLRLKAFPDKGFIVTTLYKLKN